VSRWRNGGGETREIVSFPPGDAQFGWRASIATIDADGPFSPFPGIDRVITLLHGDSVLLRSEQVQQRLLPHQPWAFPGEWAIEAQICGSCQDFNIMTRRDSWLSQVEVVQHPVASTHGVAWVLSGVWQTADGERLTLDQGMWWLDEETTLAPLSAEASLLFVALNRVL
jgi:Uncharacterized protein conserved in bacteria